MKVELRLVVSFLVVILGILVLGGQMSTLPLLLTFLEKYSTEAAIVALIGIFLVVVNK